MKWVLLPMSAPAGPCDAAPMTNTTNSKSRIRKAIATLAIATAVVAVPAAPAFAAGCGTGRHIPMTGG